MAGKLCRAMGLGVMLAASAACANDTPEIAPEFELKLQLESLPDVTVAIPSDRTDFSPVTSPLTILPPELPTVEALIPDNAVPSFKPPVETAITSPLPTPEKQVRLVIPVSVPLPVPAPPVITSAPVERPQPKIAIVPPPIPSATPGAIFDRAAIDTAFDSLWRIQSLPNAIMQGVKAFYDTPGQTALWVNDGALNARAHAILTLFDRGAEHGLDPARYAKLRQMIEAGNAETREIATSVIAALYARDARGGRINPQQVSRLITATPTLPETAEVLTGLRTAPNPAAMLEAYHPRHAGYHALRQHLAALRAAPELTASLPQEETPRKGRRPRAAPNPVADVIANMERWRWLPTDLGEDHVFVNIPSFSLTLQRNNAAVLATRVVVGKPQTPTPVFSDKMQFLVVNPYWNVPPSIALKEYLPLLQRNPYALQARGLEVISRGRVVDPATVDWSKVGRTVAIRQPPGERNALGNIKFMFPNQHAVYLHDTPSRGLFSRDYRAYSHGCVRVENPFRLAEAVLAGSYTEGRLRSMVGGAERQLPMANHLPVHLAYFTSFVDGTGTLSHHPDLYGHNARVRNLLGL